MKALAWCPFQSNLLASGGGTADRSIRFWNTITGAHLNAIDTHSQAGPPPPWIVVGFTTRGVLFYDSS